MLRNWESSLADVKLLFYSPNRDFTEPENAIEAVFEKHGAGEIFLAENVHELCFTSGLRLITVTCRYSLEEKIYPILKEIYELRTTDDALIAASAIFGKGGYTERIVLYRDRDIFEVGNIRKLADEEISDLNKECFRLRRKCFNQWNQTEDIGPKISHGMVIALKQADETETKAYLDSITLAAFGLIDDITVEPVKMERLLTAFKLDFLSEDYFIRREDCRNVLNWGKPLSDGKMYIKTDGMVYEMDMLAPMKGSNFPLYTPFEQFQLYPDAHIANLIEYGWSIKLGGNETIYLTLPDETPIQRNRRACRDWSQYQAFHSRLPVLFPNEWDGETPETRGAITEIREKIDDRE